MRNFRKLIASFSVVAILSSLVVNTAIAANFSDVDEDDLWYAAVEQLVEDGVVTDDEEFNPERTLNRAEATKLVILASETPLEDTDEESFDDVKVGDWFHQYVETAASHEIVNGYGDGNFGPGDNVTRAQLAKIIVVAFDLPEYSPSSPRFDDVDDENAWFYGYVETAYHWSVINGYGNGDFGPNDEVIRGHAALMIYRAVYELEERAGGDDDDDDDDVEGDVEVDLSSNGPEDGDAIIVDETVGREYRAVVAAFDFEAGADSTITEVELQRKGFIEDDAFDELHLYVDGEEVADGPSNPSSKVFKFSSNSGLFDIEDGDTARVEIKTELDEDVAEGGDTVGFNLVGVELESGDVDGLPVSGPILAVIDQDLATAAVDFDSGFNVSEPEIGVDEEQLAEFDIEIGDDVLVDTLAFTIDGSVSRGDLANFILTDEDDNELATASSIGDNDSIIFDDLDLELDSDDTFKIYGDIVDGAARTFEFTIDDDNESFVYDQELGVRIELTGDNDANEETIGAGDFDIDLADDSPLGNVPLDGEDVLLARYEVRAGGERVKVTSFSFGCLDDDDNAILKDVKVKEKDGSQLGSTDESLTCDSTTPTASEFTFGSSLTLDPGETTYIEIYADLDDATIVDADTIQIDGGTDYVEYDLLDSDEDDQTIDLPDGEELIVTDADVDVILSGDTPDSGVIGMGEKAEVGRWTIESSNEPVDLLDANFTFDYEAVSTEGITSAISSATLSLYQDDTLIDSVTESIKGTNTAACDQDDAQVWFGNDEDKDACGVTGAYDETDQLEWELEEDEVYELVLEVNLKNSATGSSAPLSGATIQPTLATISYDPDSGSDVDDDPVAEQVEIQEIRAARIEVTENDSDFTGSAAANQEAMRFEVAAASGLKRATLGGFAFTLSNSGTYTGTGAFTVRKGSLSGSTAGRLNNATPTNTGIASVTDGTDTITFDAAHGLSVGDVFAMDMNNDGDVADAGDIDIVVHSVTSTTVVVAKALDGDDIDLSSAGSTSITGAGTTVFVEEGSLYVPFSNESDGRITAGTSQIYSVAIDTTGAANDDTVNLSLSAGDDVDWFDNDEGTTYSRSELFATTRIDEFPVQSEWER